MCNGTPFTVEKISPRAGLELGTSRSVDQRSTHRATGARIFKYIGYTQEHLEETLSHAIVIESTIIPSFRVVYHAVRMLHVSNVACNLNLIPLIMFDKINIIIAQFYKRKKQRHFSLKKSQLSTVLCPC